MKFFIDTANIQEIRDAASLGIVDGVTTSPSLVAKEGRDFQSVIREIASIVNGPISAEVTALEKDGMLVQGHELAKMLTSALADTVRRFGTSPAALRFRRRRPLPRQSAHRLLLRLRGSPAPD